MTDTIWWCRLDTGRNPRDHAEVQVSPVHIPQPQPNCQRGMKCWACQYVVFIRRTQFSWLKFPLPTRTETPWVSPSNSGSPHQLASAAYPFLILLCKSFSNFKTLLNSFITNLENNFFQIKINPSFMIKRSLSKTKGVLIRISLEIVSCSGPVWSLIVTFFFYIRQKSWRGEKWKLNFVICLCLLIV